MSLDGYYEGPGKNVMVLFDYRWDYPADESFDVYNAERLRRRTAARSRYPAAWTDIIRGFQGFLAVHGR